MSSKRAAPARPKRHVHGLVALRATASSADKAGDSGRAGAALPPCDLREFRSVVWGYWRKDGRHTLPWRKTENPYRILVSEVMLQQTQVDRVAPKYRAFLKTFPTARALSSAPLSQVLRAWSGLGYNRRAKYLHEAAKRITRDFRGDMRKALEGPLPGVGPYTRAAVRIFAWDEPHTLLETNIRSVFIHHFFEGGAVHDRDIIPLIEQAAEGQDPRRWHWALMDYGAHIKKAFPNPSRRSAQYAKPSKFEGSLRQVRGAILKAHTSGESFAGVRERFADRFDAALASLVRDGLMERCAEGYPW